MLERIQKARSAGYSDDDIAAWIKENHKDLAPRIDKAIGAGHNATKIVDWVGQNYKPDNIKQQPEQEDGTIPIIGKRPEELSPVTRGLYGVGETVAKFAADLITLPAKGLTAIGLLAVKPEYGGGLDNAVKAIEEKYNIAFEPKTDVGIYLTNLAGGYFQEVSDAWDAWLHESQTVRPVADISGKVRTHTQPQPLAVASGMAAVGELFTHETVGKGIKGIKGEVKGALSPERPATEVPQAELDFHNELVRKHKVAEQLTELALEAERTAHQPQGTIGQKLASIERQARDIINNNRRDFVMVEGGTLETAKKSPFSPELAKETKAAKETPLLEDKGAEVRAKRTAEEGRLKKTKLEGGRGTVWTKETPGRGEAHIMEAAEDLTVREAEAPRPQHPYRQTTTPRVGRFGGVEEAPVAPEAPIEPSAVEPTLNTIAELKAKFLEQKGPAPTDTSADMGKLGRRNLGGERVPERSIPPREGMGEGVAPEVAVEGRPEAIVENASGESAASVEAINRVASEKAAGQERVAIDTRSGQSRPLIGVDAVDYVPAEYEIVIQKGVGQGGADVILDAGGKVNMKKARAALEGKTPTGVEEPLATEAAATYEIPEPAIDLSTFTFEELEAQFMKMMEQGRDKSDPLYKAVHDEIHNRAAQELAKAEAAEAAQKGATKKTTPAKERAKAKPKAEEPAGEPTARQEGRPTVTWDFADEGMKKTGEPTAKMGFLERHKLAADEAAKRQGAKPAPKAEPVAEPVAKPSPAERPIIPKSQKALRETAAQMDLADFNHNFNPLHLRSQLIDYYKGRGLTQKAAETKVKPIIEKYQKTYDKVNADLQAKYQEAKAAKEAKVAEEAAKKKAEEVQKKNEEKAKKEAPKVAEEAKKTEPARAIQNEETLEPVRGAGKQGQKVVYKSPQFTEEGTITEVDVNSLGRTVYTIKGKSGRSYRAFEDQVFSAEKKKPTKEVVYEGSNEADFDSVSVVLDEEAAALLEEAKKKEGSALADKKLIEFPEDLEKSEGHVDFIGYWEYFQLPNGKLYRAPIDNPVNHGGWRRGAEFIAKGDEVAGAIEVARGMKKGKKPLTLAEKEAKKAAPKEEKPVSQKSDAEILKDALEGDVPEVRTVSVEALKSKELQRFLEVMDESRDWSKASKPEMVQHILENFTGGERFLDVHKQMYDYMRGRMRSSTGLMADAWEQATGQKQGEIKANQGETKFYSGLPMDMIYDEVARLARKSKEVYSKFVEGKKEVVQASVEALAKEIWGEKYVPQLRTLAKKLDIFKGRDSYNLKDLRKLEFGLETLRDKIQAESVPEAVKLAKEIEGNWYRDLTRNPKWGIGALEVPVRIFEKIGKQTKEFFYDRMREADTVRAHELRALKKEFKKQLKKLGRGRSKSEKRITEYAISEQKGGLERLRKQGIEPPKWKDLTIKEREVYNWMRNQFDLWYKEVNASRKKAGLTEFKKVENYFTFWTQFQSLVDSGRHVLEFKPDTIAKETPFRFRKKRWKEGDLRTDGFKIFELYADSAIKHKHITPLVAEWHAALSSKKIAQAKPYTHAFLSEWVNRAAGMQMEGANHPVARGINYLNRNLAAAVLSYNVRTVFVQPTAVVGAVAHLGARWVGEAALNYMAHPIESWRRIMKDSSLITRQFDAHVSDVINSAGKIKGKVAEWGMKPLQHADLVTAQIVWDAARRKGINLGLKGKELITFAEDAVTKTQASARAYDLSPVQHTVAGKFATLFQTFVINNFDMLQKDVLGLGGKRLPKGEIAARTFRYMVGIAIVNAIFEDVLQIQSPFPTPFNTYRALKKKGKSDTEAALRSAAEVLDFVPFASSLRYGSSPLGPTAQLLQEFGDVLSDRPGPKKNLPYLGAKVLGVPGTEQGKKYIKRRKWGYNVPQSVIGAGKGKGESSVFKKRSRASRSSRSR